VKITVDGSLSLREQLDICAREIVEATILDAGTVTLAAERLNVHRAPFYRLVRRLGMRLARYEKNAPRRIETSATQPGA